ncbi:uncharacterized protein Bfra_003635 [Botrytis fragariae]|uniref:Uncharacterized protein n=1 Tax=Botrytis fragariae TaxID=1964551 RepID=A0A8H6AX52_9HELO|nr:uncharacterized protein Bfra_003635 [Botrytis fragariae]KAF5875182.1 hypothetical protein Bfra_003635 [Botrytis fragariae]
MSDMESQMPPLILECESLYITLNGLENDETRFHWRFYLWKDLAAKSDGIGKYFHATDRNSPHKFSYEDTRNSDIQGAIRLRVALKIAIVTPAHWDGLGELLSRVPMHASTTCRTWGLEALKVLDEEGIAKLKNDGIKSIERECLKYARIGERIIEKSNHCKF